jgi:excisionase family DNA binding protein
VNSSSRIAYSIDEFAKLAGIGRTTVYAEIKAGRLITAKVGKRTLLTADEVRRWLERLPTSHAAAAR